MKSRVSAILVAACILVSCASRPMYLQEGWRPGSIAILPFTNDSADVSIGKIARRLMYDSLSRKGFRLLDLDLVDSRLDSMGIAEAGQLSAATDEELADALQADCVLYGNIMTAKRVLLGFYYTRKPSPLAMVHQLARWWDSGYARIFS